MSKLFALLAILLILSGVLVLAVPKAEVQVSAERGIAPQEMPEPKIIDQARDIAEKVNAPLSIFFGLVSLYYSRRTYLLNRERAVRETSQGRA
jgi:hypothetical protein